ncbi:MAG: hypothetical protein JWM76_2707 [Pseudonocardiales bacterium]|nr:hypothetical protein [Pseudonocardiales bacterium]
MFRLGRDSCSKGHWWTLGAGSSVRSTDATDDWPRSPLTDD